ncbi:MAG: hypothetical protein OXI66_14885 [Boseongicola sp.]|nr:hypothetical protein [Boseongicola sp.]MDE0347043.1 hypothetical protein [Boseongicola sp.]
MDLTGTIDGYCERTDPAFWSEPVNAVTNLAFLVAAIVMWKRTRGMPAGQMLSALLFLIGVGSGLFHTFAAGWAALADVAAIVAFTLAYLYVANRDFMGWPIWMSGLGTLAFLPYSLILTRVFETLPFFAISSFYWPLPLLIFAYSTLLLRSSPVTSRNLAGGAAILCVSLTARSVDELFCMAFPLGTHFVWHLLNAIMLGWMIETWRRHRS